MAEKFTLLRFCGFVLVYIHSVPASQGQWAEATVSEAATLVWYRIFLKTTQNCLCCPLLSFSSAHTLQDIRCRPPSAYNNKPGLWSFPADTLSQNAIRWKKTWGNNLFRFLIWLQPASFEISMVWLPDVWLLGDSQRTSDFLEKIWPFFFRGKGCKTGCFGSGWSGWSLRTRSPLAILTASLHASKAICFGLATWVAGCERRAKYNERAVWEEEKETEWMKGKGCKLMKLFRCKAAYHRLSHMEKYINYFTNYSFHINSYH